MRISTGSLPRIAAAAAALALVAAAGGFGAQRADAQATAPDDSVIASFEGGWLRLADDWGDAQACASDVSGTRCYRSEAEMDRQEPGIAREGDPARAACTPSVRLYVNTSYGGNVLQLTVRGTVLNLASYGFSNVTSSYKIGACSARLYDTTSGATLYPGSTSAGVWASSMSSGWDNRVSSAYIF